MSEKVIGKCEYCNEPVLENEQSLLTKALIHAACENDIQAEIQDQKGQW